MEFRAAVHLLYLAVAAVALWRAGGLTREAFEKAVRFPVGTVRIVGHLSQEVCDDAVELGGGRGIDRLAQVVGRLVVPSRTQLLPDLLLGRAELVAELERQRRDALGG